MSEYGHLSLDEEFAVDRLREGRRAKRCLKPIERRDTFRAWGSSGATIRPVTPARLNKPESCPFKPKPICEKDEFRPIVIVMQDWSERSTEVIVEKA